ncbi:MAG TPA: response regulator transcription factor [Candidatus Paceibacterota bacterium]|nr:response regulator transcription factor [Verrucomicrobiota bacterium]HRY47968.1 response regulator transcription factor [Candidatus Paceibacterota bacterium]HSA00436.1 response regulator transcription factor [Candidatus Paceibacterota bacterium]
MIKVAIIEDNATVREGLETIVNLAPECVCVGAWSTAEEGLRMLREPGPDVLLMDIQLPNMSGVECAAHVKARLPETQIIMVTVYEDPDRIFRALRAGACGYMLKRSTPEQIVAAIREVHGGGAPMTSEIARKVIAHFREPSAAAEAVEQLSGREKEVLELVAGGFSNKEIASRLGVSVDAIRWHLKHIYSKLHVHSRTQAALRFHSGNPEL